uniref:Uncharacterized protein n=1 Tax=Orbilia brochopaga TaxID=3140254 RepID=A0A4Y5MV24_9PEZI|nr:hypothetical protein [Drechslerella brochopaga]
MIIKKSFIKSLNKQKFKTAVLSLSNFKFKNSFNQKFFSNSLNYNNLDYIDNKFNFKNPEKFYSTKANSNSRIFEIYSNKNIKLFENNQILDEKSLLPKHQPAAIMEWNQSAYSYDRNEARNYWGLNFVLSKWIRIYFYAIPVFVRKKMYKLKKRLIINKVYISKPNFLHTSKSILITLYFFAEQRNKINKYIKQNKKKKLKYFNVDYLLNYIDKNTTKPIIDHVREVQYLLFKTKINSYWLDGILEKDKLQFFKANFNNLKVDWFKKSLVYYNDIIYSISKILKVVMLGYKLKLKRLDINKLILKNIIRKWINVIIKNYPIKWIGELLCRDKLLNSGKVHKTFAPNYYWKIISGWINYSCKVINKKFFENTQIKGNRGSKSVVYNDTIVKEQRVNDNKYNVFVFKVYSNKILKNFLFTIPS